MIDSSFGSIFAPKYLFKTSMSLFCESLVAPSDAWLTRMSRRFGELRLLGISGVDYESLDHSEQEYAVKRLEAALKAFGSGFHV